MEGVTDMPIGKKLSKKTKQRIKVLASRGLTNCEISRALGISEMSVKRNKGEKKEDVKKIVKSKKKAGKPRGDTDTDNIKIENGEGRVKDQPGELNPDGGEKLEFIGGKNNMEKKKDLEAKDSFNICGSCGAEVKGEPDKCPSCGAEFEYE